MSANVIIIKKYPNRRLYDTSQSQYVNLNDIKALINSHKAFQVVDSKTGEDVTKSLLLQIIAEQESTDQQSLLTNTLLMQLIRFYDSDMQAFVRQYLEMSLAHFLDQQDAIDGFMKQMVNNSPMGLFNQFMQQANPLWPGQQPPKKD
ncbi:polyhydroxyalkanoate synthesis repressor PhaR [Simiduia agarivorans]|uniref:Polyhydroxyalkanoate synthesis repressor PhaR n=1 Tax=Simiduia agarivorans (strain DSM 21679 / JCM 13881 / BCRC 17597 / SA1) TaxID=1117647 RepID=K4KPY8_SIMAS|nr:polyhydroxyalkanoate synthesis repressor PhaR [Simiduia agarivorans]AFV00164.1 polyhydroxyalkanoate synthesis repressor PhaR [Simiduia agarivorans SA1 = DSM 21679]